MRVCIGLIEYMYQCIRINPTESAKNVEQNVSWELNKYIVDEI